MDKYTTKCFWDHPFSTYASFSEKLTFLTPWYAHVLIRKASFSESFADVLNGWCLLSKEWLILTSTFGTFWDVSVWSHG